MKIRRIIDALTLDEKIALVSGGGRWSLAAVPRLGIPQIRVADGPHGLRKQNPEEDLLQIGASSPATCFPTSAAVANSWDPQLLFALGRAVGEECLQEGVSVVLGPGANLKRSPLGGRNFEYFSEDPWLSGELAAAWIQGVQSTGVGASLKHFAANNQEKRRMTADSVIDERALRELYLSGFEKAVRQGRPWTVMAAYNQLNGIYCSEHHELLTAILRREWGFQGLVLSDGGAVNDRVAGIKAGLDLEMSASYGINAAKIEADLSTGRLTELMLDKAVRRVLELIFRGAKNKKNNYRCDYAGHHTLAAKAAAESAVLLKNEDNILPLDPGAAVAVIGQIAKKPRYQGGGSSLVNPTRLETVLEKLKEAQVDFSYAPGYLWGEEENGADLLAEACHAAQEADLALLFVGLPDTSESEGRDRTNLDLPAAQTELIERIAALKDKVVVVLAAGSPLAMPWLSQVQGVLHPYLPGQAGAGAVVDLLWGKKNPSGKLAESYPLDLEDVPSSQYFSREDAKVEYRESIYVGYRYYDRAEKEVLFPFGHGLSYTSFRYGELELSADNFTETAPLTVRAKIKNTGGRAGAEVAQLYVHKNGASFRPEQELKGFKKVFLEPGEEKTVEFILNSRSFAYFNVEIKDWHVEEGYYQIRLGPSSRDIRLRKDIYIQSSRGDPAAPAYEGAAPAYYNLKGKPFRVSRAEFASLCGRPLSPKEAAGPLFDLNSTLEDLKGTRIGRFLIKQVKAGVKKRLQTDDEENPLFLTVWTPILEMPFRSLIICSAGQVSETMIAGVLAWANKQYGRAFKIWMGF
ncbi:MAG: glycosyl hydrolase [Firmicutes bacterium]|nr:glycosyl hydrolase [Bacillota bacterium]